MYVVQCVFQFPGLLSYRFCWHETYCIWFFKENETNFFVFFKEISFYKSEFIQIIILSNQKHPPYHHNFQRAILTKFPVQINSMCILCPHCMHRFSHFESIMTLAVFIWVSQFILKLRCLYRSAIFHGIFCNGSLLIWSTCVT